jgi:hypothetical protein
MSVKMAVPTQVVNQLDTPAAIRLVSTHETPAR